MGLLSDIFGGSSSSTSATTTTQTYENEVAPTVSPAGNSSVGLNISPVVNGGSTGTISAYVYDAPVDIQTFGNATGDSALAAQASLAAQNPAAPGASTNPLASLFSGNNLYWILGAVVLFLWAKHEG